jgi:hypothetical protein
MARAGRHKPRCAILLPLAQMGLAAVGGARKKERETGLANGALTGRPGGRPGIGLRGRLVRHQRGLMFLDGRVQRVFQLGALEF